MKHGPHSKRPRGRTRRNNNGNANRHYDSNGPDVRIRGTASQIFDKYQSLARDASSSGDRILAESYLQHAEHYFRIMLANNSANGRINALPGDPLFEQMQAAVMNADDAGDDGDDGSDNDSADGAEVIGSGSDDEGAEGSEATGSENTEAEQKPQQRRRRGPGARRPRKPAAAQEAFDAAEPEGEAVVEKKSAPKVDPSETGPDAPDGGASEAA